MTPEPRPADRAAAALLGVSGARTFFPELESLRGIAVLLVFLMHATGQLRRLDVPPSLDVSPLLAFIRDPRAGVDVFFVLSGFLISLPFVQAARGGRPVALRDYFTRRALRILPLYAAFVVIGTLATSAAAPDLVRAVPFLVFANSVVFVPPMVPWSAVWWSLGTEVQFYVALPLIALAVRKRPRLGAMLATAWAVGYVAYVTGRIGVAGANAQIVLHSTVVFRAPLFAGGAVAAWVYDRYGVPLRRALDASAWMRHGGADVALIVALAVLGVFFRWCVSLGPAGYMPRYQYRDLIDGAVVPVILLLLLVAPLRLKPLLSNPALARLGVLSYSIYLLHLPLLVFGLRWLRDAFPAADLFWWTPLTVVAVGFLGLVCVALAELTYAWIEQPFLRRKARFDSATRDPCLGSGRTRG